MRLRRRADHSRDQNAPIALRLCYMVSFLTVAILSIRSEFLSLSFFNLDFVSIPSLPALSILPPPTPSSLTPAPEQQPPTSQHESFRGWEQQVTTSSPSQHEPFTGQEQQVLSSSSRQHEPFRGRVSSDKHNKACPTVDSTDVMEMEKQHVYWHKMATQIAQQLCKDPVQEPDDPCKIYDRQRAAGVTLQPSGSKCSNQVLSDFLAEEANYPGFIGFLTASGC
eukprot:gnl/MRDRNA2_/MRDRNA2_80695_c0_seq2.p1 gnl/MRDRNA2_/MRDRNA2_80695_c0~~gnl/MRDRNA2_/MRDRNA2_80695_c0_seq2.p1  ORF type:complete len:223 (-),score=23.47 gnl/MRDRNA2_/MRDRNA2_80695_c0_seq2:34-702(-)